jgi:hypothetical protein
MISSTLSPLPNSEEKEEVVDPATLVNQETIKNIRTCMKKMGGVVSQLSSKEIPLKITCSQNDTQHC